MSDFFISYTIADQAWAEWIAWALEAGGYSTTIQAWDFPAGDNFILRMHQAVQDCERTVVVLSDAYQQSHFGSMEWAAALAQKKKLLPIRIEEVEPAGLLTGIAYIDLVGLNVDAARDALLARVQGERLKPPVEPSFPAGSAPRFPIGLSSLPEKKVPEPGPLPTGSRMPFAVNPLFVGREDDLRTLARQLKAGKTSAVGQVEIAAATGLGGIGKTQLASEFVHRYGRYFEGGVFWMSFADPAAIPAEVAAGGRSLGLHPSYDSLPLEQQIRLVEEAWTRSIPRLLVFDNCEEEGLLSRWRPRFGSARVLVTCRRARWDRALGVQTVALTTLPRAASIELLRRFRSDVPAEEPALSGIAAELGDLPLALHLAGSFLDRYSHAPFGQPAAYLESLRQGRLLDHPSLQGRFSGELPTEHEVHVGRTFALSFERLDLDVPTDALALALLARSAHFAAGEPIPRDILLKTVELGQDDEKERLREEDALDRLTTLGLLDSGPTGALVMHRLVAELARNSSDGEEAKTAVEEVVQAEASRLNQQGIPGPILAWQLHLRAITDLARNREDTTAAGLCNTLGFHLEMIGDYQGARPYYERALAIREKVLGLENPYTATSLNNLGALLYRQGDLAGARPYYERALAIQEEVQGPENPSTALSLNNLGGLLNSQGDFAGARPYYERALAVWEKALSPEHPDTAISLNNLGALLDSQGDFAGARRYFERTFAILERVLGPEHPDTATSLNNLGALLDSLGDFAGARRFYERALAIREKVLGQEHPDTAGSLNNLGFLLQKQGNFTGASPFYERALAILEARLGPDHPNTKIARGNLEALSSRRRGCRATWFARFFGRS